MSGGVAILVVALLVGWAIWGVLAWPPLKRALTAGDRSALIREYRQTIAGELILSTLATAAAVWAGLSLWSAPDELGIGSIGAGDLPVQILAGVAGGALVGIAIGLVLARRTQKAPQLAGDIDALVPVTRVERRWFVALCLCVGVCEEILYRGFMGAWLSDLGLNGIAVLAVGSVFFALAHAYQGLAGALATMALGALLHVLYVGTGSLWAPIVVHVLLDLRLLAVRTPSEPAAESP